MSKSTIHIIFPKLIAGQDSAALQKARETLEIAARENRRNGIMTAFHESDETYEHGKNPLFGREAAIYQEARPAQAQEETLCLEKVPHSQGGVSDRQIENDWPDRLIPPPDGQWKG